MCSLLTAVCVHLDGLNAEDQFRVWVTILDNTSHYYYYIIMEAFQGSLRSRAMQTLRSLATQILCSQAPLSQYNQATRFQRSQVTRFQRLPAATHSCSPGTAPSVSEIDNVLSVLPVMATAILCVWAAHTTVVSPEVAAHSTPRI